MNCFYYRHLADAFSIRSGDVVTLVGAGGKTTFMFTLAKELAEENKKVITTTTTKIWIPTEDDTDKLIVSKDGRMPSDIFNTHRHVTCVTEINDEGKAVGVNQSTVDEWKSTLNVDCIIVEADGSKGKSFKAPIIEYEPKIPSVTTLYVPIVGIDILNKPLSENFVHRPEVVAKLTGARLDDKVSSSMISFVLRYYLKIKPKSSRSTIFINKISNQLEREKAISITKEIDTDGIVGNLIEKKFWLIKK